MLLPGNQGKATWMHWESVPAMKLRQREISAENNDTHNQNMLLHLNKIEPVCLCRSITLRNGKQVSLNSHYDSDRVPPLTILVKHAIVQLSGWNAKPEWGLFHTSLGKIIDIVYNDDESPLHGHLPMYVLVDFQSYIGPPFDSLHPTYIPIPPHTARCKYNCGCQRHYIPLTLAFGKTIHSFQGQNVGPTLPHQPENPIQTIVVDPGTRAFEGSSPGLLYSIISRSTTLGYLHDIFTSPLFFTGFNMTTQRLQHITLRKDGRTYGKVLLRTMGCLPQTAQQIHDTTLHPAKTSNLLMDSQLQTFYCSSLFQNYVVFSTSFQTPTSIIIRSATHPIYT